MKWGFIYILDSPSDVISSNVMGEFFCVGVPNTVDAEGVARQMLADGVELIELCGGFGGAGLASVIAAVQGRIPVGAVFYGVDASSGLQRLFGQRQR